MEFVYFILKNRVLCIDWFCLLFKIVTARNCFANIASQAEDSALGINESSNCPHPPSS